MANLLDHHLNSEAASPSMSKAEDNLSNSDGPLIRKREPHLNNFKNGDSTSECQRWTNDTSQGCASSSKDNKNSVHCLWSLTIMLAIIGTCNLLLSVTVIIVLRVSQGMESLEVIPSENLVKFYGNTDLDSVCLKSGICEGFGDEPVHLIGDGGGVEIDIKSRLREKAKSKLQVKSTGTVVSRVNSFEIKETEDSEAFFFTDFPNFGLPNGVGNLDVRIAQTHRVVAPMNESLRIEANKTSIHGGEGATLQAKDIIWSANNDILLNSKNGDVILEAKNGVFIDVKGIPVAPEYSPNKASDMKGQYKLCICMPQGKVFKVPIKSGASARINCAKIAINVDYDPCL